MKLVRFVDHGECVCVFENGGVSEGDEERKGTKEKLTNKTK